MSKNVILCTINNDFIENLSTFSSLMVKVAKIRKNYKELIGKEENKIAELVTKREELIEQGLSADDAMAQTSVIECHKAINVLKDKMAKELEPLNKSRRELVKGLDLTELYSAYVVGTEYRNYSAIGTAIRHGKKKDYSYTCKKSFNTLVGAWLAENGVKNADNEGACRRFTEKMVVPFIGNKLDKNNAHKQAYSQSQFTDNFLVALIDAMVVVNFLVKNDDATLVRKSEIK